MNMLKKQPVLTQKTHADEEQEWQEEAEKCQEVQQACKATVTVIASLEDTLASQDKQHEQVHLESYKNIGK